MVQGKGQLETFFLRGRIGTRSDSLTSSSDIERQTPILNGVRNAQQQEHLNSVSVPMSASQPPINSPGRIVSSVAVITPAGRSPSSMGTTLPIVEMTEPNN
jgi:hypothetical protein